jgi:hypothetical protein
VHPLFNDGARLTDEEREFLARYGVRYVLINPRYQPVVGPKLAAEPERFALVYSRDGFQLYEVRTTVTAAPR